MTHTTNETLRIRYAHEELQRELAKAQANAAAEHKRDAAEEMYTVLKAIAAKAERLYALDGRALLPYDIMHAVDAAIASAEVQS